jgi:hypothetical protein
MLLRRRAVVSTLLALALLTMPLAQPQAQTAARGAANKKTMILTFSKTEQGAYIEPIVILDRGRYLDPPWADSDKESFNSDYFKPGQSYRILQGGAEVGTALVEKPTGKACIEWGAADAKIEANAQVEEGLATDSATLGRKSSARRTPTDEERDAALKLARTIFRQKRVSPALLKEIGTTSLIATDLNHDGQAELIGNFYIGLSPGAGIPDHALLLVMEPQGSSYRAALAHYYRAKSKSGIQGDVPGEDFLDQLDLDADGTDELFVRFTDWEAWDFGIYKKQRGRWKLVYRGAGGGC